jgi:hypothetical protein
MISTHKWQVSSATSNIEPEACVSTSITQTVLSIFVLGHIPASAIISYAIFPEWYELSRYAVVHKPIPPDLDVCPGASHAAP